MTALEFAKKYDEMLPVCRCYFCVAIMLDKYAALKIKELAATGSQHTQAKTGEGGCGK